MLVEYKRKLELEYRNANGICNDASISVVKLREWFSKRDKLQVIYTYLVESFINKDMTIVEMNKGVYDGIAHKLKRLGYHISECSPYANESIECELLNLCDVIIDDSFINNLKVCSNLLDCCDKQFIFGTYGFKSEFDILRKINRIEKLTDKLKQVNDLDIDLLNYEDEDAKYAVACVKVKQKKRF